MVINQQSLHQLDVGFKTIFNKRLEELKTEYQMIATTVPSSTAIEEYGWLGDLPSMREWVGSRVIQELEAEGYKLKNVTYELTEGIPRSAIEDDQYGIYAPIFANMADAGTAHQDEIVFDAVKAGFEKKCFDGKEFYAEDHPVGDAAVSNRSNAKLSVEAYAAARTSMMSQKNAAGRPLRIVPDLLMVPPTLEEEGLHILNTDYINGTTNPYKGTAKLMVTPNLAGHDSEWHLLCTSRFIKPFLYQQRKKLEFIAKTNINDDNVFFQDLFLWGIDCRDAAGYGLWQLAYGSTGTNAG